MPLGSSSDAPVTRPGPRARSQRTRRGLRSARSLTVFSRAVPASVIAASVWQNRELTNCGSSAPSARGKELVPSLLLLLAVAALAASVWLLARRAWRPRPVITTREAAPQPSTAPAAPAE